MFETAELGQAVTKEEYQARERPLRADLVHLQHLLKSANFNVAVLFAGIEGGGKGEVLYLLHEWMDPRFLCTHVSGKLLPEEKEFPYFWPYWRALPPKGRIGIFYGSWYARPWRRVFKGRSGPTEFEADLHHISTFEEMLTAEGTLLLKFWFHMSKPALKQRLEELKEDKERRWQVRPLDRYLIQHYGRYRKLAEQTLRLTNSGPAPWQLVEAADWRFRNLCVAQMLRDQLARRLQPAPVPASPVPTEVIPPPPHTPGTSILSQLDLTQQVSKEEYKVRFPTLQADLFTLTRRARKKGVASVLVFEGWDAAGKGTAIRRLVAPINPRDYKIIPVAAPTDEERAQHYLWRFWRHIPRAGHITVFDRSWYGRVLVERVEGFASEAQWRQAYKEIADFEAQLHEHGIIVVKFWLHIDKEEQLRRFQERESTPFKQFKISAEDYRNREKWDAYDAAVNDMIQHCSTSFAPWTLVEANDKRFARIKVLQTYCNQLKERVG